ncbi:relaxase/mobilization nuclease domain-containing protein [Draconibacterium orientale]|uniref:relaxase/mobilization nuclease domain-containing protein n=1 Tax=Draconibacterium orientale TaxID=1168034 RepID=UPI002ABE701A|nr:relaxase/mobilization nuclease domain-containing protein [Draconibacterium orientale]
MIAKITTGGDFAGAVEYILDPKKAAELLMGEGVRLKNTNSITKSFVAQTELNTRVSKPVGHISLDFSVQDKAKLNNEFLLKIADDYLNKMGIVTTQFIIARHYDKEHPHIHIVFNRVNNQGKTISNKNDRYRSEKICKELTRKNDLYFVKGKENVKVHRLKEPDKKKYEIYNCLKELVPKCKDIDELEVKLKKEGIAVHYKCRGNTNVVQGISFTKNDLRFNGSKIDRQFSYSKIKYRLDENKRQEHFDVIDNPSLDKALHQLIKEGLLQAEKDEERRRKRESYQQIKPKKKRNRGYRM